MQIGIPSRLEVKPLHVQYEERMLEQMLERSLAELPEDSEIRQILEQEAPVQQEPVEQPEASQGDCC